MSSSLIAVVGNDKILWLDDIPLCIYTTFSLCIHQLMDTWVFSMSLAIVKNATMNLEVQLSISISGFVSFEYIPRSGIARSYGSSWGFLVAQMVKNLPAQLNN